MTDMEEMRKKNDRFELDITDMSDEGAGIGRSEGFIWFVKDAVVGDRVLAAATKVKKQYGFARLVELLEPSPDRVAAACPIARQCGGCQLQALSYEAQLRFKQRKVLNHLRRIGGLALPEGETAAEMKTAAEVETLAEVKAAGEAASAEDFVEKNAPSHETLGAAVGLKHETAGTVPRGSGVVVHPIMGAKAALRYRNKAQVPFGTDKEGRLVAGFYAGRSHSIIPCTDCLLGAAENAPILDCVLAWMKRFQLTAYDERSGRGLVRHVLIRKAYHTGEMMVCLVINAKKLPHGDALVNALLALPLGQMEACGVSGPKGEEEAKNGKRGEKEKKGEAGKDWKEGINREGGKGDSLMQEMHWPVPAQITSISYCVNQENTNVIMGTELQNLYGPGYLEDEIWEGDLESGNVVCGNAGAEGALTKLRFRISPLAFYQVNPVQMERLYQTALRFAGLGGTETVWDLYCGIGTISLFLAKHAKQVYGLEIIPEAVENARDNAARNGLSNTEFFVGKAEEVLPAWYKAHPEIQIDVIVTDPPRKGCDPACLETMVQMQPKRIVYVSCDSATLARDLKYLSANGYEVREVQVVDQFANTVHVEVVIQMTYCGDKRK